MALNLEQVIQHIKKMSAECTGVSPAEVDLNKNFRLEYGVSSIEASEFIMELEENYKIRIPVVDILKILTAQNAIDYVMKHAK
jgi:acyl carrier protein